MPDPDPVKPIDKTPAPPVVTNAIAPGWKTSEHVLSVLAIILTALYSADIIPTGSLYAKLAAVTATVLTALGYAVVRGSTKAAALKAAA